MQTCQSACSEMSYHFNYCLALFDKAYFYTSCNQNSNYLLKKQFIDALSPFFFAAFPDMKPSFLFAASSLPLVRTNGKMSIQFRFDIPACGRRRKACSFHGSDP